MNTFKKISFFSAFELLEKVDNILVPEYDVSTPSKAKEKSTDNSTLKGKSEVTTGIDAYRNSAATDKDANFLANIYTSFSGGEVKSTDIDIAAKRNGDYRSNYAKNMGGYRWKAEILALRKSCTSLNWRTISGTPAEKGALYVSTKLAELGYFGLDGKVITPGTNRKDPNLQFAVWIFQRCCGTYSEKARPIYKLKNDNFELI